MICIESIHVSPQNLTLKVGDWFYDTHAEIVPDDTICQRIFWYSDAPNVATVDAFCGNICAIGPGTAHIYAVATDESQIQDCCTVTVTQSVSLSSIVLNKTQLFMKKGENEKLNVIALPYHAENRALQWRTGNPFVATVNNGCIHACGIGGTTISVCAADNSHVVASCYVLVTDCIPVSAVTVIPSQMSLLVGEEADLLARVDPKNAANRTLRWSSEDSQIVTVDPQSGHIQAQAAGCTAIIATAEDPGEKCGACLITVEPPIPVEKIILNRRTLTLERGNSTPLAARIMPTNVSDRSIKWTSSAPLIATVDAASGMVTGRKAGKATIIANAQDGSGAHATCSVTVKDSKAHAADA